MQPPYNTIHKQEKQSRVQARASQDVLTEIVHSVSMSTRVHCAMSHTRRLQIKINTLSNFQQRSTNLASARHFQQRSTNLVSARRSYPTLLLACTLILTHRMFRDCSCFRNAGPLNGLVRQSAFMSPVGTCLTLIVPS